MNTLETDAWFSNVPQKRRDKLYIIAEILEIAKDKALKTQIMYRANLSFTQLNDYLNFMLKTKFLERFVENGKEFYKPTKKGLNFLQRYRELTDLLSSEDEGNSIKISSHHLIKKTN
ncbi:MAG: winged helix-turn-helix domain-containing protein [Nitrososphaerota archaeon]|nr:winged helix-turn-helix domain-containing protein [Candidatus Bathyarchaeota archaeon]MDW8022770.1 winged helix-turn-helix domain-containing protein [Nitrososphaerota archaeon]